MVEIRAELEQTGTLNAKKQREKILKLLDKWYPQINAFEAKLKPYDEQLQRMRDELIRSRSTMPTMKLWRNCRQRRAMTML